MFLSTFFYRKQSLQSVNFFVFLFCISVFIAAQPQEQALSVEPSVTVEQPVIAPKNDKPEGRQNKNRRARGQRSKKVSAGRHAHKHRCCSCSH